MRNRIAIAAVLGFVVILLLWNFAFFGPAGRDRDHAKARLNTAQQTGATLESQLRNLQRISQSAPEQAAHLARLNAAVPPTPDLEGFIRSAVDLEQQAGVDWVSVEPAVPAPGASATQIKMQVIISGGFFQVLDYLNRLETLSRLVVVDGIDITTGSATSGSSTGTSGTTPTTSATSSSGAPLLTVTLNARMFTQAAPPAGSTGPGGTTTPTTTSSSTTAAPSGAN